MKISTRRPTEKRTPILSNVSDGIHPLHQPEYQRHEIRPDRDSPVDSNIHDGNEGFSNADKLMVLALIAVIVTQMML